MKEDAESESKERRTTVTHTSMPSFNLIVSSKWFHDQRRTRTSRKGGGGDWGKWNLRASLEVRQDFTSNSSVHRFRAFTSFFLFYISRPLSSSLNISSHYSTSSQAEKPRHTHIRNGEWESRLLPRTAPLNDWRTTRRNYVFVPEIPFDCLPLNENPNLWKTWETWLTRRKPKAVRNGGSWHFPRKMMRKRNQGTGKGRHVEKIRLFSSLVLRCSSHREWFPYAFLKYLIIVGDGPRALLTTLGKEAELIQIYSP